MGRRAAANCLQRSEERFKKKIPPGFADASSKAGDERYGDLIVWKQLIEFAKTIKVGLIFVTDDSKSDWWTQFGGRTVGPHSELLDEMAREAANIPFYMYSGQVFLRLAKQYLPSQITDASLQEVKRVHDEQEELSLQAEAPSARVIDLMEALKASLGMRSTTARENPSHTTRLRSDEPAISIDEIEGDD